MSEFDKATSTINKIIMDYEELASKIQRTMQEKMKEIFASFFADFPEVKTIHWTQYAPHFNDGDECVFSVREPYFSMTEYKELQEMGSEVTYGEGDEGIIELSYWDSEKRAYVDRGVSQELRDAMKGFDEVLQSDAVEPAMRAMFGESVWVLAHRDGFEVVDYDHD